MHSGDCSVYASAQAPSQLRVVAYYETYRLDEGYLFPHAVVELAWEIDGRVIERYFYGRGRGLVKWVEEECGWKSYLVEGHLDRPPMEPPAWPSEACHPRPSADLLYYREPIPEPEPLPAEVYVKKGIPWLNLRTGPGTDHLDIGDLHPGRGPIRVVEKRGDWFKGEIWFHGDYVMPAEPSPGNTGSGERTESRSVLCHFQRFGNRKCNAIHV